MTCLTVLAFYRIQMSSPPLSNVIVIYKFKKKLPVSGYLPFFYTIKFIKTLI
jgi:hypothetical protein